MKIREYNSEKYQLPDSLESFQEEMYVHLINWKWKNITRDKGIFIKDGKEYKYDTILPDQLKGMDENKLPHIYPSIRKKLAEHHRSPEFTFKIHPHFYHMSSSQAANTNLFLPLLEHTDPDMAARILSRINPNIKSIARKELDNGFKLEYWGKPYNVLNDHNETSGTDSDIAIAFYDHRDELCLWLVEHKLCEADFTACGGFKSPKRKKHHPECICTESFSEIVSQKDLCYYHSVHAMEYWKVTEEHRSFFPAADEYQECPFQGGMNQLWRNQLLGLAIEQDSRYTFKHVYFSVVRHAKNRMLDDTLVAYKKLIGNNPKFSEFTSRDLLIQADEIKDPEINLWIQWYKNLYNV